MLARASGRACSIPAASRAPTGICPRSPALRHGGGFFLDRFAELVPGPARARGRASARAAARHALGSRFDTPNRLAWAVPRRRRAGPRRSPTRSAARCLTSPRAPRRGAPHGAWRPRCCCSAPRRPTRSTRRSGAARQPGRSCRRAGRRAALGAALLALASLFSWSLLGVGAWAAILAWRRHGARSALALAALCGVVLVAGPRRAGRRDGLGPARHAAGDRAGLPLRDRGASVRTGSG